MRIVERYRPSLDIINAMASIGSPSHRNFAMNTFNRAKQLMSQPMMGTTNYPSFSSNQSGSEFERLIRAVAGKESGGNYGAVNRSSGALGKYQIMPGNVRAWSQKYLGRTISPTQFLRNPSMQEQIARAQLLEYYKRYGAAGAATAWYAGPGAVNRMNSTRSQGAYPTIQQYWKDILRRMG